MLRHRHRWVVVSCDCSDYPAEVERDCCCVTDTDPVCMERPIRRCRGCGTRQSPPPIG